MRALKRAGALINEEKDYIGSKIYYWHGYLVKRKTFFKKGRKTAEQICISKRKDC